MRLYKGTRSQVIRRLVRFFFVAKDCTALLCSHQTLIRWELRERKKSRELDHSRQEGIGFLEESSIKKTRQSPSSNAIKAETLHQVHLWGGKTGDVRSMSEHDSVAILSFISLKKTKMSVQTFYKASLHTISKCTAGMPRHHIPTHWKRGWELREVWPWKICAIIKLTTLLPPKTGSTLFRFAISTNSRFVKFDWAPYYTEFVVHVCSGSPEWRAPRIAQWPPHPPSGWAPGPGWESLWDKAAACGSFWMAGRTAVDSHSVSLPLH